jgi:hypothetical protein
MLLEARHRHVAHLDRNRSGFDLRKVEDVVDEREQVGAGAEDGAGELGLLLVQVALRVVASSFERISSELSGVRSSWHMLARNSDLYLDGQRQLLGLSPRPRGGPFDLDFFASTCFFSFSSSCAFS